MSMIIPLTVPYLGDEETEAASKVIRSGWVTQGPVVEAFEKDFAHYVGANHACAVSNCTAALHLALLAVGVRPGNIVLTVSHSFIATANAIRHCGAEPLFVDIAPESYNIDSLAVERILSEDCEQGTLGLYYKYAAHLMTPESPLRLLESSSRIGSGELGRIAAILPVHQMGFPCEIGKIEAIAKTFELPVIEDAACAIGSEIHPFFKGTWERIGAPHGDLACFSFHPRKVITTGEGGMITTNDPEIDALLRRLRQHGMSLSDRTRHASTTVVFESYLETGFNYRMTDIQAAIGIQQLRKLDHIISSRKAIADAYGCLLSDISQIASPSFDHEVKPNFQSYPIRILDEATFRQRELMQSLLDAGIATRPGIMNIHEEPPYRNAKVHLCNSERARRETILLPMFSQMDDLSVERVSKAIRFGLGGKTL